MTKQLTQDIFKNSFQRWKSAATDEDGSVYRYTCKKSDLEIIGKYPKRFWVPKDGVAAKRSSLIGKGYDTTNWQHSAIDRE